MKISRMKFYGGSRDKVCRLGMAHLFLELLEILLSPTVQILDRKQANGAARVRELIDDQFSSRDDWVQSKVGDVDWIKKIRYNETVLSRLGVEVQVSGRRALLARDIVHIRNSLQDSRIDVGVIVVSSDEFAYRLTDRVANYTYAVKYIESELREAQNYPIILMAVEHDGYSDEALPKKTTNRGR